MVKLSYNNDFIWRDLAIAIVEWFLFNQLLKLTPKVSVEHDNTYIDYQIEYI